MANKIRTNRQRIYRVLTAVENVDRLQLFVTTSANAVQLLRQMMQTEVVDFVFRKEGNTEMVRRLGTLIPKAFKDTYTFKEEEGASYKYLNVLTYWDLTRNYWRNCLAENIVGYFEHDEEWQMRMKVHYDLIEKNENNNPDNKNLDKLSFSATPRKRGVTEG